MVWPFPCGGAKNVRRKMKRPRMIYLYQPLDLGKEDKKSTDFFHSYLAVEERYRILEEQALKVRRREQNRKLALYRKGFSAIQDAIKNRNSAAIESVKSDRELYEIVCEIIGKLDTKLENVHALEQENSASKTDLDNKNHRTRASDLRHEMQMLKMQEISHAHMDRLGSLIEKGDAVAAKTLVEITQSLCTLLHILAKKNPDLFRSIGRKAFMWPVLAQQNSHWVKDAKQILTKIEFGEDTLYANFRNDLVFDENYPARSYALALVKNIEFNRYYLAMLSSRMPAIQSLIENERQDFEEMPSWSLDAARLPKFSADCAKQWMAVARTILRQQHPDFHLRPEWKSISNRFESHEKGRIQNKILDQIGSAMRTIAKSRKLPK
jgi:hypothetical protein